MTLDIEP